MMNEPSHKSRRMSRWRLLILILTGLMLIWLISVGVLATSIHLYGQQDNAEAADLIVVLGAGVQRDGRAGWALTRRSQQGAELWRQGFAPLIVCSGGQPPNRPRSEAEACRDVLLREGVPDSAIRMEMRSRSTEENAIYTRELMDAEGWERAIIVSDSYHVLRARWLFEMRGVPALTSPVPAERIRGRPTYNQSLLREIVAIHWQIFKDLLGLPYTHVP